jgi:hypothetical protein
MACTTGDDVTPDQLPDWNDPRVQTVYALVSDPDSMPPDGEHWDGWVSKRIVAALAASPPAPATPTQPLGAPASPSGSPLQPPAAASAAIPSATPRPDYPFPLALDTLHADCHKAANAFWSYWQQNGETHKRGYYESTWGAINCAIRMVGVREYHYGKSARGPTARSPNGDAPEREAAP